MNKKRLEAILSKLPDLRIIVYGDYFLDDYLTLDRQLSETSLETGLEAYQVIETRKYPGVAGVVTANLRSLGVNVVALGLVGDDGNGYDLRKKLVEDGVDVSGLLEVPGYATPTYHKPMMREPDGREHELNRMDVKPRAPLAAGLEEQLVQQIRRLLPAADGLLVVDQARNLNCGVVTDWIRQELERIAGEQAKLGAAKQPILVADSRDFLGRFKSVILKANLSEAMRAAQVDRRKDESDLQCAQRCAQILIAQTQHPLVITLGDQGIYLLESASQAGIMIPAIPVDGPLDIVGAGDSVNAAVGAALCAGASLEEAGFLGNLVASIVIKQIGVTGKATPQQVLQRYQEYF